MQFGYIWTIGTGGKGEGINSFLNGLDVIRLHPSNVFATILVSARGRRYPLHLAPLDLHRPVFLLAANRKGFRFIGQRTIFLQLTTIHNVIQTYKKVSCLGLSISYPSIRRNRLLYFLVARALN